jgi:hypothetical protein
MKFKKLCEMAYPQSFSFENFNNISSYSGKVKYAATHLQRMTSGSSRVIFKIDDEKVLKVAKNIKGLAQNNTEQDHTIQQWYGDIVAKVFSIGDTIKDEGPFYLEMELAKKLSPKRFKQILGLPLSDLQLFLQHQAKLHGKTRFGPSLSQEFIDNMYEQDFVINLWDMIQNFDMSFPGDFGRINSYGEVMRDGQPHVVLVDFGLSNQVWLDYYARN